MKFLQKKVLVRANRHWLLILAVLATCYVFGANRWMTKVGFPAICAMFAAAALLSFFLRDVWEKEEEEPDA